MQRCSAQLSTRHASSVKWAFVLNGRFSASAVPSAGLTPPAHSSRGSDPDAIPRCRTPTMAMLRAVGAMRALQRVRTMANAPIPNKESVSSLASRIDLKGVTCLVRSDLNTPFAKGDGPVTISDDTRIKESLPTLRLLTDAGAKVVVCSHVGRPKGKRVDKLSTAPIAARLSELLGKAVASVSECNGEAVAATAAKLAPGELLLLENLRFHAAEENTEPSNPTPNLDPKPHPGIHPHLNPRPTPIPERQSAPLTHGPLRAPSRRRTIPPSPSRSSRRAAPPCTSTTPSVRRTARTRRLRGWRRTSSTRWRAC